MRVVFMGTPDFSVGTLEALVAAGHEIVGVVTQPDKPKGRGGRMQYTPVKEVALKYDLPVFQPLRVKDPEFIEVLKGLQPEIIVVVAFGQILPKEILEMPEYGCVNVHASLLPKYRGAAPIQWAVIDGEKVSGVTTMRMDEGLDTGDMILKKEVLLDRKETGGSLFDKLSVEGASLCVETLKRLLDGTAEFTKQDDEKSTYAKMLKKELGDIDWNDSAVSIERLIRGLTPWPSAYTHWDGKVMKIWDAEVSEDTAGDFGGDVVPGTIVRVEKQQFDVQTGNGLLIVKELQIPGKKRMDAGAFLRGYQLSEGTILTTKE